MKVAPKYVAQLVGFLCSPAAQNISGQLFGVRGREVFLFSQPRPLERVVAPDNDWSEASLSQAIGERLAPRFVDLTTDLDAFSTEPII